MKNTIFWGADGIEMSLVSPLQKEYTTEKHFFWIHRKAGTEVIMIHHLSLCKGEGFLHANMNTKRFCSFGIHIKSNILDGAHIKNKQKQIIV